MNMTEGNIKKTLFHFALPMILSLITQQLYNVVDMVIVGRYLGVKDLAAVGNAGTIVMILVTLSGGLEMGSEVIFAKYLGSKKYKDIVIGVKSILMFGFFSGICITALGTLLKEPVLDWIKVPRELAAGTGTYYSIYLAGVTGIFLYDIARAILIALEKPKISMFLVIFTSLLNVILDLIFICDLKMGVGGAALATILSQLIGMLIALVILKKTIHPMTMEHRYRGIRLDKIKEILSISLPTIFQQVILSLSSIFLVSLVNPFGSGIISGYITVNKIVLFGMLIVIGISQALSVFTASNYGAGNLNRIRLGYRFCMIITTFSLMLIIGSNFVLPKYLIGAFLDIKKNKEAYEFARNFLQFSSFSYLLFGWKIINESLLRGCLKMKAYLVSNLSELLSKTAMTYVLVLIFSLHGFWMGNMFGKLISFVISAIIIIKSQILKKID